MRTAEDTKTMLVNKRHTVFVDHLDERVRASAQISSEDWWPRKLEQLGS